MSCLKSYVHQSETVQLIIPIFLVPFQLVVRCYYNVLVRWMIL